MVLVQMIPTRFSECHRLLSEVLCYLPRLILECFVNIPLVIPKVGKSHRLNLNLHLPTFHKRLKKSVTSRNAGVNNMLT